MPVIITGNNTPTAGGVTYGDGSTYVNTAAGTSGQLLQSNGASAPTWVAAPTGALVLLSTVTASNSATVDIETTFDSTYDVYLLVASGITVVSNGDTLTLRMKIGGSYITTSTYFYHHSVPTSNSTAYAGTAANGDDAVYLASVGSAASRSANYEIMIYTPSSTALAKQITWRGTTITNVGYATNSSGGAHNTGTAALTGIRIAGLSGNILAGKFRLYGIAN